MCVLVQWSMAGKQNDCVQLALMVSGRAALLTHYFHTTFSDLATEGT